MDAEVPLNTLRTVSVPVVPPSVSTSTPVPPAGAVHVNHTLS